MWKRTRRDGWNGPDHRPATQQLMLRGLALFVVLVAVGAALSGAPERATADHEEAPYTGTMAMQELSRLYRSLNAASGELELTQLELQRARAILEYSARYHIPADLAQLIYDTALQEGLDPDLAFRIVKIESNFRPEARSPVGAVGLVQVMPRTAAFYDPTLTIEDLLDPKTNLRIGFRYFRYLLERYGQDLRMALLAYNRGPARVEELRARGLDPANGYASSVTAGYRRTGPALP